MRSSNCDSDSTPKPIGLIFPVKGCARNTAGTCVTFNVRAIPLSLRAFGKPGIAPPSTLIGDVDLFRVAPLTSAYTPVPGGVGPLTVAMLQVNTLAAGRMRQGLPPRPPGAGA